MRAVRAVSAAAAAVHAAPPPAGTLPASDVARSSKYYFAADGGEACKTLIAFAVGFAAVCVQAASPQPLPQALPCAAAAAAAAATSRALMQTDALSLRPQYCAGWCWTR